MRKTSLWAALAVLSLTLASHYWWIPALNYPLSPGTLASRVVADPTAVNHTLSRAKIGFVTELLVNEAIYLLLTLAALKMRTALP
jgi:hypothetical protein